AHERGSPRPSHWFDLSDTGFLQDVVDRRAHVLTGGGRVGERPAFGCRLVHLGRSRRAAIAAYVNQVNVPALLSDIIHHRAAAEWQIKGCFCRVGRTVDEKKDLISRKTPDPPPMLVSDIIPNFPTR